MSLVFCDSSVVLMECLKELVFFFKQKTAYDIGLGIPAEPLFRSRLLNLLLSRNATSLNSRFKSLDTLKVKIIKIGRASCRERVKIAVDDLGLIKRGMVVAMVVGNLVRDAEEG